MDTGTGQENAGQEEAEQLDAEMRLQRINKIT